MSEGLIDKTISEWNNLTELQQEEYIQRNMIKTCYTHDSADVLQRGFGELGNFGDWEYRCKKT